MNVARRLTSRLALPTARAIGRHKQPLSLIKTQKRTALYTGERHGSFTLLHGRPPILYGYFFTMSWPLRFLILAAFGIQAELVEHVYYGHPPADWHEKWPKYWHKRVKPMQWFGGDCDLMDIYCWKKIDPKTLGDHH
mmetsp:Transcript_57063/g.90911  ORF Transcript_57063/g.90911 Transcript_57063/m.90911 type:complete len:137 (-) Transcript_57063:24-434(-)|eukprot:CAMPEP_0197037058 /NCGR_PEP_ID=MMETSP1384-20130603/14367_1 /TAXON_ID=29189 /ORGANISM="Ammonia sp." /LENGTH=136 /DNA_ID=CAMNT_0042467311 /DNA_START=123 /DNA_END=533 /DNA_ORIENTATION=+